MGSGSRWPLVGGHTRGNLALHRGCQRERPTFLSPESVIQIKRVAPGQGMSFLRNSHDAACAAFASSILLYLTGRNRIALQRLQHSKTRLAMECVPLHSLLCPGKEHPSTMRMEDRLSTPLSPGFGVALDRAPALAFQARYHGETRKYRGWPVPCWNPLKGIKVNLRIVEIRTG